MLTVFLIFIVLLAFIFLGFPIFMSLLITGILFLTLGGNSLGLTVIKMFGSANSLSLLAIPYFVIAGNIIMKARITDKLVNFADAAVGWLPGGLGHVNVLTSMIFGGIQGSGCADAAAIGGMLIPAMEKQGYDKDYSVAVTAGSSMLSPSSAQHRHDPVFLLYRSAGGSPVYGCTGARYPAGHSADGCCVPGIPGA